MELFTNQWEFAKTPFGTGLEELSAYEDKFERVDLPHDWLIYDTLNLYETSTGWYRKKFTVKRMRKRYTASVLTACIWTLKFT